MIINQVLTSYRFALWNYFSRGHQYLAMKVVVAGLGIGALGWISQDLQGALTLSLGLVVGAITETDNHFKGRLKTLGITLLAFIFSSSCVALLMPYPALFALGLFSSTVFFVALGALGKEYATLSFGTLLVAIYSMLVHSSQLGYQPIYLTAGAGWYGIVSLCFLYVKPYKHAEEKIASCYHALGNYLLAKSDMFHQLSLGQHSDSPQLSELNLHSMQSLVEAESSLSYCDGGLVADILRHYYTAALHLHERITASHSLTPTQAEQEVVEGIAQLCQLLGQACYAHSRAVLHNQPYVHSRQLTWALGAFNLQCEQVLSKTHNHINLNYIKNNLNEINHLLSLPVSRLDSHTVVASAPSLLERMQAAFERHWAYDRWLTSPLILHGVRLGIALLLGYGCILLFPTVSGFWLLMTILFVCQSSYRMTKQRSVERILGTLLGVIVAVPVLSLSHSTGLLIVLALLALFLFFTQYKVNYGLGVCCITLYVFIVYELLTPQGQSGIDVIIPRLLDTCIGSGLALGAMYLFPQWKTQAVPQWIKLALTHNLDYFNAVMQSLRSSVMVGVDDHIRHQAHRTDNNLALSWLELAAEPRQQQDILVLVSELVWRNHRILAYIASLNIHDKLLLSDNGVALEQRIQQGMAAALGVLSAAPPIELAPNLPLPVVSGHAFLEQQLIAINQLTDEIIALVQQVMVTLEGTKYDVSTGV